MASDSLRILFRTLRRIALKEEGVCADAQLIKRFVAQNDEAAFEAIVWRHGSMVLGVCRRVLRHEQDAEDAFQATFLTLARKAGSIGKSEALAGWLYQVAYRIALRAKAGTSRRNAREQLVGEALANMPDRVVSRSDLGEVLDEEVNRLPRRYRTPFVLCYFQGLTNVEAAQQLGCPPGTVMYRLAWARERLRQRLQKRGVALGSVAAASWLSEPVASATVSGALAHSTIESALAFAAGKGVAAGIVSERVTNLSLGVLQAMFLSKLKIAGATALAFAALGAGTGVWTYQV